MLLLVLGLILFVLIHLVPTSPQMRSQWINKLGDGPYRGVFSLISIVSLVLIVMGLRQAEFVPWYEPPAWGRHATMALMPLAIYLFLSTPLAPAPSSAKTLTAHPMSWGVVVWSTAHLLANGDRAHVILFVTFLVYSFISMRSGTARGQMPALENRPKLSHELLFIAVILVIYIALFVSHRFFTGMPLV